MDKREMRVAVRDRNGIPPMGDALAGHPDIDLCIEQALRDVSGLNTWPWLLTSANINFTTGTGTLPADCQTIRALIINGLKAKRAPYDIVVSRTDAFVWTEFGASILLYPAATITQTTQTAGLHSWRVEPALETDIAIPLIPTQWHQMIVCRASYFLNMRRGDSTRVAADLAEWQVGLKNLMNAGWRTSGPRMIRDAFRPNNDARWSTT
jgi:hypothetical protein